MKVFKESIIEKLESIKEHYNNVTQELGKAEVVSDQKRYIKLSKEHSDLTPIIEKYEEYKKTMGDLKEDKKIIEESSDSELKEIARGEIEELTGKQEAIEEELKILLLPKDLDDSKNVIMELRAGTGGNEAGIFAGDLYRMYSRYIEKKGWKVEEMSLNPSGVGGFKEVIFSVNGDKVYGTLKYESGVHRVQRVPVTEASGRIHTSAASIVVLPEAEEVDITVDQKDLKIDVFRSTGPGGQSVNTTDSAVRITHIPTGMVVTCQDEKSQYKNKVKAMKVLRARLLDKIKSEEKEKIAQDRKTQVGSGDRSAKIRTYNFPQGRVTDHRIGLTLYKLDEILQGELDEIIEQLKVADRAEKLKGSFRE